MLIIFTQNAELLFLNLLKKYNLEENEDQSFEYLEKGLEPREVMIKKTIRAFAGGVILEKDLIDSFKKITKSDQDMAEKISKDIIENLIPLLDKVPEDQLSQYNLKKEQKAPRKPTKLQVEKEIPLVKKVNVTSVEENAINIREGKKFANQEESEPTPLEKFEQLDKAAELEPGEKTTKKFGENRFREEKKGPDKYREATN